MYFIDKVLNCVIIILAAITIFTFYTSRQEINDAIQEIHSQTLALERQLSEVKAKNKITEEMSARSVEGSLATYKRMQDLVEDMTKTMTINPFSKTRASIKK